MITAIQVILFLMFGNPVSAIFSLLMITAGIVIWYKIKEEDWDLELERSRCEENDRREFLYRYADQIDLAFHKMNALDAEKIYTRHNS